MNQYARTELLLGKKAMEKIHSRRIAVFGLGGVGGYVVEALARSGIGTLDLIDSDKISLTNLNRQIFATRETIGQYKVDVAKKRIHEIDPAIQVNAFPCFYLPDTAEQFDFSQYDYIVDAIDTVAGKLEIIKQANALQIPVISSMGTGNKLNPSALRVADIYETKVCPLARVMRHELKRLGIKNLKVIYSEETPIQPDEEEKFSCLTEEERTGRKAIPGSTAFVPPVAGLMIASEVIQDVIKR